MTDKNIAIQRDWTAKISAGLILGAVLALAITGIYNELGKGTPLVLRGQVAMWLVPPVWLSVLGTVFFFRSGKSAWTWLGAASALGVGAHCLLRSL